MQVLSEIQPLTASASCVEELKTLRGDFCAALDIREDYDYTESIINALYYAPRDEVTERMNIGRELLRKARESEDFRQEGLGSGRWKEAVWRAESDFKQETCKRIFDQDFAWK